ncbi:MAG: hypothetical protein RL077_6306 [Verrucomicrobiota bacterium]|jgi:transcriptional regulator GlxA family with amidase domain
MAEGLGGEDLDPVQRAVSFIATHFANRLEMAWVARHVSFVSAGHLARMFKDKMGVSPNSGIRGISWLTWGELGMSYEEKRVRAPGFHA